MSLSVAGCASVNLPANVPAPAGAKRTTTRSIADVEGDTALGLAFSGGGTRAAAFAFGVLRGLQQSVGADGKTDLDRVAFVSGVSGGSVTAAYFGLKGAAALDDLRERFLIRNAEEDLSMAIDLANLARGLEGGVNDSSRLPAWLDRNLFDHATMGDLLRPDRPIVWINASDLYHRTPFVFSEVTFGALCSDLKGYPLSQAVAASAAVPVAFVPITLQTFPQSCSAPLPAWTARAATDEAAGAQLRAVSQSLASYRDPARTRYLKLADGGITDNFGLSGLVIARAAASRPYMPLTADKAVQLRRLVFVVVNAGRPPQGEWSRTLEGPSGAALLNAVTDTAIDSAVRSGFDAFRLSLREWEEAVRKWRCSLTAQEARKHGAGTAWRCNDITFEISEISFDRLDAATAARLSEIPTRFQLPVEDVDALISGGLKAVAEDRLLQKATTSVRH
ncbi:patatin-like phospholipase family protein [Bradyrhizobium sp. SRS-191]|uniref:patatin-like phospholipase family protein n=1 Tax=Bradyrhizobium sp. SRS-191 TaxID=2962606 RepID=UPI00211E6B46|nr:patatin-like phospholipase family protein [Bradyrhizobium sp. SRS-191]